MPAIAPSSQTTAAQTTLVSLRQKVADRLNARLPQGQTGSNTAPGTRTSFIDLSRTEPDNTLINCWVNFVTGGNAGVTCPVLGNVNGEILLAQPLTTAPAPGDTYDLYRRFHPNQFRDGVNFAIRNVFPQLYQRFEVEVAEDPTTAVYQYPAGLRELRQLRRRVNPGITPASYVELRGEYWDDLQGEVRIHYRPASGQFLYMVGYSDFPEVTADSDTTSLPLELVVAGACQYLYLQWGSGEAASSTQWALSMAKYYEGYYEQMKRKYAMPAVPFETHPPRARVVRGMIADLGPINP